RQDTVFEERVPAIDDATRGPYVDLVGVVPQRREQRVHPQPRLPAEQVGQLAAGRVVLGPGPYAGRRHREQLRPDVDDPAQEALLAFELALPAGHRVEGLPGELA